MKLSKLINKYKRKIKFKINKMNKNSIFILLVIGYFNFCLALSIISPFFPAFAESHGISQSIVGIIFSANPVGAVIAALTLGKILNEVAT
jgi:MFS family permease